MGLIQSLNGNWTVFKDPEGKLTEPEIRVKLKEPGEKIQHPVPSNWHAAGFENYSGTVWYCRTFHLKLHRLSLVEFRGADYFTDVWLNGQFLGHHEGYFQTFHIKIPDSLMKDGEYTLIVRVTSPKEEPGPVWPFKKTLIKGIFGHHDCRPGANSHEFGQDMNTGGIWNSVTLMTGLPVRLSGLGVSAELHPVRNQAVLLVQVSYHNSFELPETVPFNFHIVHPDGTKQDATLNLLLKPDSGDFSASFLIENPEKWYTWDTGPQPVYSLTVTSELSGENRINFGIKSVRLDEKKHFFLNGKRLFLRGTNVIPEQLLSTLSSDRIETLAEAMKEAGVNCVRVHAHVNREEFYRICDQKGILVWQDFALQWTYSDSPGFVANAVSQITDMVRQLKNHVSIAVWCCHNEPGDQIHTLDPFLQRAVLAEDATRIVRLASNYEEHPYDGWYWGNAEQYASVPMGPLVTEFGAQGLPEPDSLKKFIPAGSLWPPVWKDWEYHDFQYNQTFNIAGIDRGNSLSQFAANSQSYQSYVLETAIGWYRRKRYQPITGIFQFMFQDCWPSVTWSVIDYYGKRKSGFHTLKRGFEPVHLSVFLRQKTYLPGRELNIALWAINDTWKSVQDCRVEISVSGNQIWESGVFELPDDNLVSFPAEAVQPVLPVIPGPHRLIARLTAGGKILSEYRTEIEIMEKV